MVILAPRLGRHAPVDDPVVVTLQFHRTVRRPAVVPEPTPRRLLAK